MAWRQDPSYRGDGTSRFVHEEFRNLVFDLHLNEMPMILPALLTACFHHRNKRLDLGLALTDTHVASQRPTETGLILLPNTLLRMSSAEVVKHATNTSHIVHAARPWLKTAHPSTSPIHESHLDNAITRYQDARFERLGLVDPFGSRAFEDSDDEEVMTSCSGLKGFLSPRLGKKKPVVFGEKKKWKGSSGLVVRQFSVWIAREPKRLVKA